MPTLMSARSQFSPPVSLKFTSHCDIAKRSFWQLRRSRYDNARFAPASSVATAVSRGLHRDRGYALRGLSKEDAKAKGDAFQKGYGRCTPRLPVIPPRPTRASLAP